ncbi:MAG: sigma 54-interacting transcriptional regulator [Myxococcota bacterium]
MSAVKTATRLIDREGRPSRRLRSYTLRISDADELHTVAASPIRVGSKEGNEIVVADPAVSRMHFEISADPHGFRLRDLGSTNGTFVDGRRVLDIYLSDRAELRVGSTRIEFAVLDEETDVEAEDADRFGPLLGKSLPMRELYAILGKAAPTPVTVLIEGETGAGKELVARAVHEHSRRASGPFVVFDCAAVPVNLVESILFGHERGAFSGANTRQLGRLEEAQGGTLFLDELGELPLDLQPKLLRALEERAIRRVGGQESIPLDVRFVAATNRDLAAEINRGAFREDLYYRLAVVRVLVPPLRERREDIRLLAEHFVRRALRDDPPRARKILAGISDANWKRLVEHPWPGNVRELRNVLERTMALASESVELPAPSTHRSSISAEAVDLDRPFVEQKAATVARFEEAYLTAQLERHQGNISRAAAASGIDRMYFKRLMKKYR